MGNFIIFIIHIYCWFSVSCKIIISLNKSTFHLTLQTRLVQSFRKTVIFPPKDQTQVNKLLSKMSSRIFFGLSKFEHLKEEYLGRSPLEKWLYVRQLNIFLLKLVGVQFMEANYKFHWKTWIPMYLGLNYFTLSIYTGYYYWGEPFKALQSTTMSGLMVPVRSITRIFL